MRTKRGDGTCRPVVTGTNQAASLETRKETMRARTPGKAANRRAVRRFLNSTKESVDKQGAARVQLSAGGISGEEFEEWFQEKGYAVSKGEDGFYSVAKIR